jgi:hypothetical protein
MPTYFYCCSCGDGPHSTIYNSACPYCNHTQCSSCTTDSHDTHQAFAQEHVHPHAYPTNSSLFSPAQSAATNPTSFSAYNNTPSSLAHSPHAPSYIAIPATGGAPYSQRPEHRPVWRWLCCACGGSNSVKTDAGCANCCNHWKRGCCQVYDANAR